MEGAQVMSTRSTTHFVYDDVNEPMAIVYRHTDGYPEGAGKDLMAFLAECKALPDSRLSDPSYLAAKYVVFLADMFNVAYDKTGKETRRPSKLDFLSVGVVMEDPGDIEYRYTVQCGQIGANGLPVVTCFHVAHDWEADKRELEIVEIPS